MWHNTDDKDVDDKDEDLVGSMTLVKSEMRSRVPLLKLCTVRTDCIQKGLKQPDHIIPGSTSHGIIFKLQGIVIGRQNQANSNLGLCAFCKN